jgi:NAD(P)-dependent dehydrogenase (short-subunit alcohol dehydrogenase family)
MGLLDNKVAIITGAGRGLGETYARRFAAEGAAVVVNDVGRDADGQHSAEQVAAAIRAQGGRAVADTSDISSTTGGQALCARALEAFGGAHILVNNAGILRDKSLLKLDDADWDDVQRVNLRGIYAATRPVFAWMKDHGGGVIVNTSSTSGLIGNFGQANYAASKGGVWAFSNVLAIEGRKAGIRVWTLAPAAMSALTASLVDAQTAAELKPEYVAEVVLYMVSALSGERTGRCVYASGQRIMELRMVAEPGIAGGARQPDLNARTIAAQAERIFSAETPLALADLAKAL